MWPGLQENRRGGERLASLYAYLFSGPICVIDMDRPAQGKDDMVSALS